MVFGIPLLMMTISSFLYQLLAMQLYPELAVYTTTYANHNLTFSNLSQIINSPVSNSSSITITKVYSTGALSGIVLVFAIFSCFPLMIFLIKYLFVSQNVKVYSHQMYHTAIRSIKTLDRKIRGQMDQEEQLEILNGMILSSGRIDIVKLAEITKKSENYWYTIIFKFVNQSILIGELEQSVFYTKPMDIPQKIMELGK